MLTLNQLKVLRFVFSYKIRLKLPSTNVIYASINIEDIYEKNN